MYDKNKFYEYRELAPCNKFIPKYFTFLQSKLRDSAIHKSLFTFMLFLVVPSLLEYRNIAQSLDLNMPRSGTLYLTSLYFMY